MNKYGVDSNGYIITQVAIEKIKTVHLSIIDSIVESLNSQLKEKVHSIYIYGSVATGNSVKGISDLDILIVFHDQPSNHIKSQLQVLENNYSTQYVEQFRDVGFEVSHTKEIKADTFGWCCFLKHLSVCVYGDDLSDNLHPFKPTRDVAKGFNGDIEVILSDYINQLHQTNNSETIAKICRKAMRKIVRTGFCLVMPLEQSWTTNLEHSYLAFSRHYPEKKQDMEMALGLAQKPSEDKEFVLNYLINFGSWISEKMNEL